MNLRPLTPDRTEDWLTVIADHDRATAYHSLAWKRSVAAAFPYEPAHRLCYRDGDPVAAWPAFSIPRLFGRSILNPFCEYSMPLTVDGVATVPVLERLAAATPHLGAIVIKDAGWTGQRGYNPAGYGATTTGVVHRLPLDRPYTDLWDAAFDSSLRQNVRTARANDVVVERTRDVATYYELYVRTMRRHGSPQFPAGFFEHLATTFEEQFVLTVATRAGRPIAGLVGFEHGETLYLWSNGSEADALEYRPNDLLYADAVERASNRGLSTVDMGRTAPESGVDRFKRQFGGERHGLTSFVTPPHRTARGAVSQYRSLEPVTRLLAPVVTNRHVGPRLKAWLHE